MSGNKLLIINVSANSGSTGRIAEQIGLTANDAGYDSYFAYGRNNNYSQLKTFRIGNDVNVKWHGIQSRLLDNHAFASRAATRRFVNKIERIRPRLIHIHNLHGYYINIEILLSYLSTIHIPIVWTLHDCWNFTGHCSFFDNADCERWKTQCCHCPRKRGYPTSYLLDASFRNYTKKKRLFSALRHLTLVTPSRWLADLTRESFLAPFPVRVINNGVDLDVFKPVESGDLRQKLGIGEDSKVVLGVASVWDQRKGLGDFYELAADLQNSSIVLVGLDSKQVRNLPPGVIGITRTESVRELAELYSMADVFVNPTYADNFPTTNLEALACGTPVVTYKTGGSPESIDENTGRVVNKADVEGLSVAIRELFAFDRSAMRTTCRMRAENLYDKQRLFNDYVELYNEILNERH